MKALNAASIAALAMLASDEAPSRRTARRQNKARRQRSHRGPKKRIRTFGRYRAGLSKGVLLPPMEPKPVGAVRREDHEWVIRIDGRDVSVHRTAREAFQALRSIR